MTFDNTKGTVQQPVESDNHGHGKRFDHPAFGQIGAYRQQGGAEALYGSDFIHHSVVMLQIKRSSLARDLSHDWHHGEEELIQVYLSESQWATFVSSMNMGDGVPCTLHRVGGEVMPGIELAQRTDQFKSEVEEHVVEAIREIDEVLSNLPQKGAQAGKLRHARMQLQENLPFIAKSFGQHMERTVEKAKTEIHGYMNSTMQRLGLANAGNKPLELNAPKSEGDD
jgi:hypothetical protein